MTDLSKNDFVTDDETKTKGFKTPDQFEMVLIKRTETYSRGPQNKLGMLAYSSLAYSSLSFLK
jgi:hypothetical protein